MAGLLAAFMSNFAATVNAAPAYIVNDIYKRFINPNASEKKYVKLSYISSLAVVIVGVSIGFLITSINDVVLWITSALWGGYTAANVLKWYWWRFNGYGYFWGMVTGLAAALVMPFFSHSSLSQFPITNNFNMNAFPIIFGISIVGCIVGTFLTKPEDDETLKKFYKSVRPWGFWKPVHKMMIQEDPSFEGNKDFKRDMFNVVIGIVWQTSLVAFPVFIILREWKPFIIAISIIAVTSVILKFTWWNKLKD
jgi:Na+/proline symporter